MIPQEGTPPFEATNRLPVVYISKPNPGRQELLVKSVDTGLVYNTLGLLFEANTIPVSCIFIQNEFDAAYQSKLRRMHNRYPPHNLGDLTVEADDSYTLWLYSALMVVWINRKSPERPADNPETMKHMLAHQLMYQAYRSHRLGRTMLKHKPRDHAMLLGEQGILREFTNPKDHVTFHPDTLPSLAQAFHLYGPNEYA